ncbi:MAG TPA: cation diffusion facilitator family transporter [Aquihabitans sp.]|jgi:cation diffusion facilitator family transporter|nr:cation diffusion facilitator family transporter [Aquihabitans sp.]
MADAATTTPPAEGPREPVEVRTAEGGQGRGTKAVVVALLVNAAIAVGAGVGFDRTGSWSLLAAAALAAAGFGHQIVLLLGGRRATRAAGAEHPFGYGRARYFWSFVVGVVLFGLGSAFAITVGLREMEDAEALERPEVALGILGVALVATAIAFRIATTQARKARGGAGALRFVRRAKSPELPVVLLEGLGAIVGLVLALAGVGVAELADDAVWDAYGAVAIGVLLAIIAVVLVWEMKSLLIGESADRKDLESLRAAIEIEPEVNRVLHVRAEHVGPEEILLGAKVEFAHDLTVVEVAQVIDRVETNIRANVPAVRAIYLEPDVHDEHKARGGYVAEHAGHIDPDDPDYATITGQHRAIHPDDDIWS